MPSAPTRGQATAGRRVRIVGLAALLVLVSSAPEAAAAPPSNDDFANATVVPALPFQDVVEVFEATRESADPACGGNMNVWYSFTPATHTRLHVSSRGIDVAQDTFLLAFTGSRESPSILAPCTTGFVPQVLVDAPAGEPVHVLVSWNDEFVPHPLLVSFFLAHGNDAFEDAFPVPDVPFHTAFQMRGATADPTDPLCVDAGPTVWFEFTAPPEGARIEINNLGSDFVNNAMAFSTYRLDGGALVQLTCDQWFGPILQQVVEVAPGDTVFIMVTRLFADPALLDLATVGFNVIAPLTIEIDVEPVVGLTPGGLAIVRGHAVVNRPSFACIVVEQLVQPGASFFGSNFSCFAVEPGVSTPWSTSSAPDAGAWVEGAADVVVAGLAFEGPTTVSHRVSGAVELRAVEPPACPAPVAAIAQADGVHLSWPAVKGASGGYRIHRAEADGPLLLHAVVPDPDATGFADTNVAPGVTYRYVVRSVEDGVESEGCASVQATAIPFFGTGMAALLAAALTVGAFVWIRPRGKR